MYEVLGDNDSDLDSEAMLNAAKGVKQVATRGAQKAETLRPNY